MADTKAPYGDVPYGDPGYLDANGDQASKSGKPGVKRYPLSADKVMAAWSYINQAKNAGQYTAEQLSAIKGRIKAAMSKHGHDVNDSSDSSNGGRSADSQPDGKRSVERRFTKQRVGVVLLSGGDEQRADTDGRRIGGYAALFNTYSRDLGAFVEQLAPETFNRSKGNGWPDVICRFNHEDTQLLGTTAGRTLELNVDRSGLLYNVEPPPSMRHVIEWVERGDVSKSSFAFRTIEDEWGLTEDGGPLRTLHAAQLVDVAPVVTPAYADTTAGLRSLAEHFDADLDEVRSMAEARELRQFFVRTDNQGPPAKPKPKPVTGAAAMVKLMERRRDPWADQG